MAQESDVSHSLVVPTGRVGPRNTGGGAGAIWTIGHWTCPEAAFLESLHGPGIQLLADVRSLPGSRRNPQYGQDAMRGWLKRAGIGYVHLPELGGRRGQQPVDPTINAGWRQPSFKNYADYTLLPAYEDGIRQLVEMATTQRVAIMCGEPLPWRCHRLLIANTLAARGWAVWHIIGAAEPRAHQLGRWGAAPVIGARARLTYPPSRQPPSTAEKEQQESAPSLTDPSATPQRRRGDERS